MIEMLQMTKQARLRRATNWTTVSSLIWPDSSFNVGKCSQPAAQEQHTCDDPWTKLLYSEQISQIRLTATTFIQLSVAGSTAHCGWIKKIKLFHYNPNPDQKDKAFSLWSTPSPQNSHHCKINHGYLSFGIMFKIMNNL